MNKILKKLLLGLALVGLGGGLGLAETLDKGNYLLQESNVRYQVSYVTKEVEGASRQAKGKAICDQTCSFLVAIPIKSFDSGDANRDLNMLSITRSKDFPFVEIRGEMPLELEGDEALVDLELSFGGEKQKFEKMRVRLTKPKAHVVRVRGKVLIKLSQFKIERPSLLLIKVDDEVPIQFEATWKLE